MSKKEKRNKKEKNPWEHLQKRVYPNELETFFRDGIPPKTQKKKGEK